MSSLEDDLRRVLADPRREPPAWPDATQRVRAGMRRRHVRRVTAGVGVAMLAVLMVVAGLVAWARPPTGPGPADPSPSVSGSAIAWRDLPYATYPPGSLASRPAAAACRAADLTAAGTGGGGAMGTTYLDVHVRNTGAARCTLSGRPVLLYRGPGGQLVPGDTHPVDPLQNIDANNDPATIDPGEIAQVTIETFGSCQTGQPSVPYPDATLRLPDGGQVPLGLDRPIDATCGVGITQWYRPVPVIVPTYGWLALQVSLDAPGEVHIGQTLHYTVTLSNPGDGDIALDPCPNYMAGLEKTKAGGLNKLNCTPAVVRAHGELRFAMEMAVPESVELTGPVTLTWTLDKGIADGNAPAASVTVTLLR